MKQKELEMQAKKIGEVVHFHEKKKSSTAWSKKFFFFSPLMKVVGQCFKRPVTNHYCNLSESVWGLTPQGQRNEIVKQ